MYNKVWQLAGGICSLFLFLLVLAPATEAKTFADKGSQGNYIVTINIVFDFSSVSASQADLLLAKWRKGMAEIWDNKITASGALIEFDFDLQKIGPGKSCLDYPAYHCLKVVDNEKNSRGRVSDISFILPNSDKNAVGEWTVYTSALDAAHEIGHLMGLADEYHFEVRNNKKIWINDGADSLGYASIMSRTWGKVAADFESIKRITVYADNKEANLYSLAMQQ
jgi:hypothetical protein